MTYNGQGYEADRFDSEVARDLQCVICKKVLNQPVQCREKEHHFCTFCIRRHLEQTSKNCPECKEDLTLNSLRPPSRFVSGPLAKLRIRCDNVGLGCPKLLETESLVEHVKYCVYSSTVCSNNGCTAAICKKDQKQHETQECEYRFVSCQECEAQVKLKFYSFHSCVIRNDVREIQKAFADLKIAVNATLDEMNKRIMAEIHHVKQAIEGPHHFRDRQDIVVLGGWNGKSPLSSAEVYSWAEGAWTPLQPAMQERRSGASAFVFQNKIFVSGGRGAGRGVHNSIERIDTSSNGEGLDFAAKLPFASGGHSIVVYEDRLIMIGGNKYEGDQVSNGIYELRLRPPYTTKLVSSMPEARCSHGSQLIGNQVIITGGMVDKKENECSTASVLKYDVVNKDCKIMPPIQSTKTLPYAVNCAATVSWQNKVILLGGADKHGEALKTVVMYDVATGRSEMLPPMKHRRDGCTAVVTGNVIVVMGGYNEQKKYLRSVECFNFNRYVWEELESMNEIRSYATAALKPTA